MEHIKYNFPFQKPFSEHLF